MPPATPPGSSEEKPTGPGADNAKLPGGYSWRVPVGFKGKIKVEVVPSLGPIQVKPGEEIWVTVE